MANDYTKRFIFSKSACSRVAQLEDVPCPLTHILFLSMPVSRATVWWCVRAHSTAALDPVYVVKVTLRWWFLICLCLVYLTWFERLVFVHAIDHATIDTIIHVADTFLFLVSCFISFYAPVFFFYTHTRLCVRVCINLLAWYLVPPLKFPYEVTLTFCIYLKIIISMEETTSNGSSSLGAHWRVWGCLIVSKEG